MVSSGWLSVVIPLMSMNKLPVTSLPVVTTQSTKDEDDHETAKVKAKGNNINHQLQRRQCVVEGVQGIHVYFCSF